MILRGTGRGELFIRGDTLHGISQDRSGSYDEVYIGFNGFKITLQREEVNAILKGLAHLEDNPRHQLVFENEGDYLQPKYKMMQWYYDSEKNHGGPVEIQSSKPSTIEDENDG